MGLILVLVILIVSYREILRPAQQHPFPATAQVIERRLTDRKEFDDGFQFIRYSQAIFYFCPVTALLAL